MSKPAGNEGVRLGAIGTAEDPEAVSYPPSRDAVFKELLDAVKVGRDSDERLRSMVALYPDIPQVSSAKVKELPAWALSQMRKSRGGAYVFVPSSKENTAAPDFFHVAKAGVGRHLVAIVRKQPQPHGPDRMEFDSISVSEHQKLAAMKMAALVSSFVEDPVAYVAARKPLPDVDGAAEKPQPRPAAARF